MVESVIALFFALVIFLFLCTIGVIGTRAGATNLNFGDYVQHFMLGILGFTAYFAPLVAFFLMIFAMANKNNFIIWCKIIAIIVVVAIIGIFAHFISQEYKDQKSKPKSGLLFSDICINNNNSSLFRLSYTNTYS